jgi:hypothetical protein
MKDDALFRRLADRCRVLITRTQIEPVQEQLRIWAAEFDERAQQVELNKVPDVKID